MLRTLLILDSVRGVDSTGIAAIGRNVPNQIVKCIGNPFELLDNINYDRAVNRVNRCIIGHNRYATQGAMTRQNAHPFEFDTVIGVHNGTLSNKWQLENGNDFKVDSQALYNHIDKKGIRSAINIAEGAWSLVWWDKVEETLNFLRNSERSMFIAHAIKSDTIFFASEKWMIQVACSREGVEIAEPFETMENVHYTFDLPASNCRITKPTVREMKAPERPVYNFGRYSQQQQHQSLPLPTPQKQIVLAFTPKKDGVASIGKATVLGATYSGSKNVSLEVLDSTFDSHGAKFVTCLDPNMPSTNIRLYLKPTDVPEKLVGKIIIGNIGNYCIEKGRSEKNGYYKVEYGTFRLDPSEVDKPIIDEYKDHHGNYLTKDKWMDKYKNCCWCSSPVFPEEKHEFVKTSGDVLCEICMEDSEVHKYID